MAVAAPPAAEPPPLAGVPEAGAEVPPGTEVVDGGVEARPKILFIRVSNIFIVLYESSGNGGRVVFNLIAKRSMFSRTRNEKDIANSLAAGFSHHITKPVDWQKLKIAIQEIAQEMLLMTPD